MTRHSVRQVRQWVAGRQLLSPSFSARAQTRSHLQGPSFGIIGVRCTILQKVCPFCSRPLRGRVRRHPRFSGSADPAVRCVRGRRPRTSPYTLLVIPNKSCSAMQASFFRSRERGRRHFFTCHTRFGTVRGRHSTWKPPLWETPIKSGQIYFFAITFSAGLPLGQDGCHVDNGGLGDDLNASGPAFTCASMYV